MNVTVSDDFTREENLRIVALAIAAEITGGGNIGSADTLIRNAKRIEAYITTGGTR